MARPTPPDPGRYGRNVREVSERVRSGAFSEMRLMSKLSPADLRRGADLAAEDARFRRFLADHLEANDLPDIQVSEAIKLRREWTMTEPLLPGSTPCHNCAGDGRLSVPDGIVMCQQCAGSGVDPQAEIARLREESADLRNTLLSVLAHLEGRSDMSTDGNWEPRMIALIRKRVGWPERSEP